MNIAARWNQVIADPLLANLPYKIELNKFGQILMSPASNWHGMMQFLLGEKIKAKRKRGTIIVECSILTRDGVKVADVAWASDEFLKEYKDHTPYKKAPEICVEILSPGNSPEEIESKVALYLEKGAQEVWVLQKGRKQTVHTNAGIIKDSVLAPGLKFK